MGLVYANIELIRSDDLALFRAGHLKEEEIKRLQVKALVDTGAYMLTVTQQVKEQLNLPKLDEQVAELADGTLIRLEVAGPVEIRFANRRATVDAMVIPTGDVLLGAIPMEDLDVLVDPKRQQLIVNPENPYIPKKPLKKFGREVQEETA